MIKGKLKTIVFNNSIYEYVEERNGKRHLAKLNIGNFMELELGNMSQTELVKWEISNETTVNEIRTKILYEIDHAKDEDTREDWQCAYNSFNGIQGETTLSQMVERAILQGAPTVDYRK